MSFPAKLLSAVIASFFLSLTVSSPAQSPVTITVDVPQPGPAVPADFSGLSFEVTQLLPNENGQHYFRPDNEPLLRLFHTLGIKNLRIGGNTSDRDVRRLPDEADLDSLFAFAKAADLKIIYCLRLHEGDPQADARVAKYITDHYAGQLECFSIGQEPSAYPVGAVDQRPKGERMGAAAEKYRYEDYHVAWEKFATTLIAAVPDIKFCGPSVHNNGTWATRFMADFGTSNHVMLITEHLYPGGAGGKVPTPEIGRDRMLSDKFIAAYQKLYDGFAVAACARGLPYRLEEVNNYFNGGATNVSNTFASALWGLDFLHWWAAHGAAGLNFHTGDKVAAGSEMRPSRYTAYYTANNGYNVRPLGYGIAAFALGSRGHVTPLTLVNSDKLNLSAYAVADGHDVYVTVINKEHGDSARAASVTIGGTTFDHAQVISLTAPGGDVAAQTGVTLGGAEIKNDGGWDGQWLDLATVKSGVATLKVPAASATIIWLK